MPQVSQRRALLYTSTEYLGVSAVFPSSVAERSLTDQDALDHIIDAHGNLNLAAERAGVSKNRILDGVANNLPQLKRRTQASVLIELLSLADSMRSSFIQAIGQLDPEDQVKAYLDVMKLTIAVSDDKTVTQNINLNEFAFSQMDRDLQQAFIAATQKLDQMPSAGEVYEPKDGQVIDAA